MSGFPWRSNRCWCGNLAADIDRGGDPVCVRHLDYPFMFDRTVIEIATLIGKEAKDAWLDEEWPGEGDVKIRHPDGYDRARRKLREVQERPKNGPVCPQEGSGAVFQARKVSQHG